MVASNMQQVPLFLGLKSVLNLFSKRTIHQVHPPREPIVRFHSPEAVGRQVDNAWAPFLLTHGAFPIQHAEYYLICGEQECNGVRSIAAVLTERASTPVSWLRPHYATCHHCPKTQIAKYAPACSNLTTSGMKLPGLDSSAPSDHLIHSSEHVFARVYDDLPV